MTRLEENSPHFFGSFIFFDSSKRPVMRCFFCSTDSISGVWCCFMDSSPFSIQAIYIVGRELFGKIVSQIPFTSTNRRSYHIQ